VFYIFYGAFNTVHVIVEFICKDNKPGAAFLAPRFKAFICNYLSEYVCRQKKKSTKVLTIC